MKAKPFSTSPPPTPGQPILPAPEKQECDKYLQLARELAAQVAALRDLWKQRDSLLKDQEGIVSERAKTCHALHKQAPDDPAKRGSIEKSLEGVNYRHAIKQAEIEGCEAAISEAEVALHTKYPLANATFQGLYSALVDWTFASEYEQFLALVDPAEIGRTPEIAPHLMPIERTVTSVELAAMTSVQRQQVQKDPDGRMFIMVSPLAAQMAPPESTLEEMAGRFAKSGRKSVELRQWRLPPAWVRPLMDDAMEGGAKWSGMRKDTMQDVCKVADLLCQRANSILDRAGQAEGFQIPKFKLGPDEEQAGQPDEPLAWLNQSPLTYLSEEEIRRELVWRGPEQSKLSSHMEELLRVAGKSRADLSADSYEVLIHSEILQSQSLRARTELSGSRSVATL